MTQEAEQTTLISTWCMAGCILTGTWWMKVELSTGMRGPIGVKGQVDYVNPENLSYNVWVDSP